MGEWFELHNTTNAAIDLEGLVVSGSVGESFTVGSSLSVPALGYVVFAIWDSGTGGSVDYTYSRSAMRLDNGDRIKLLRPDSTVLDEVVYGSTLNFPVNEGYSKSLSSLNPSDNDSSAYWCHSSSQFPTGDYGTPGTANDSCSSNIGSALSVSDLSAGDIIISEIMHDPQNSLYYAGEWFELYNNSGSDINLNGLVVGGGVTEGFGITEDILFEDDSYIVLAARSEPAINGGVSPVGYVYDRSVYRLNSNDIVTITNVSGLVIDSVVYVIDEGFPELSGASLSLGSLDATNNDSGLYWCASTSSFGAGDLGTPGLPNDACDLSIFKCC